MRSINRLALWVHLAGLLLALAACRVEGYYYFPEADAEPPIEDWVARLGGSSADRSGSGKSIAVAPNGDLVLVGSFTGRTMLGGEPIFSTGSGGWPDIWVARYRPDGSHIWSVGMGGMDFDEAVAVAVDSAGDIYIVGSASGGVNFGGGERPNGGGFIVKLAGATGNYTWDRTFSSTHLLGISIIDPYTIAMSAMFTGMVDFGGQFYLSMPSSGYDCALVAYDSSTGNRVWSRHLSSTGDEGTSRCNVVGVDGDVVATGSFAGTSFVGTASGESDVFLARFRGSDGTPVWSMKYGGTSRDTAYALTTEGTHVFVGGQFMGTTNLGGPDLSANGGYDAFVSAYRASDGAPIWSQRLGGARDDETVSIAANSSQLTLALSFAEAITIGTQSFNVSTALDPVEPHPPEGVDVAIARLDPASGGSLRAWHFENTEDRMTLIYAGPQLAGSSTFGLTTNLLGTTLTSVGGRDIATFRVDLDRVP